LTWNGQGQFDARKNNYAPLRRKRVATCVPFCQRRVTNVREERDIMVVGYGNSIQFLALTGGYEFSGVRAPFFLRGWTCSGPVVVPRSVYLKIT
jgi:hypothetical protein